MVSISNRPIHIERQMPYVMKTRNESIVYFFDLDVSARNLLQFFETEFKYWYDAVCSWSCESDLTKIPRGQPIYHWGTTVSAERYCY